MRYKVRGSGPSEEPTVRLKLVQVGGSIELRAQRVDAEGRRTDDWNYYLMTIREDGHIEFHKSVRLRHLGLKPIEQGEVTRLCPNGDACAFDPCVKERALEAEGVPEKGVIGQLP